MEAIKEWLINGVALFIMDLHRFTYYYVLRDRIPFYVTLSYIMKKGFNMNFFSYVSKFFLILAGEIGIVSIYFFLNGFKENILTGFNWSYIAIVQYAFQILTLSYIGWKKTSDIVYGVCLGYNGASATGYLYEIPYWLFSKNKADIIHVSFKNVFFFSFQMVSIIVFLWMLKTENVKFHQKDLIALIFVYALLFVFASLMYVFHTYFIARLPIIFYSLYLASKLGRTEPL